MDCLTQIQVACLVPGFEESWHISPAPALVSGASCAVYQEYWVFVYSGDTVGTDQGILHVRGGSIVWRITLDGEV